MGINADQKLNLLDLILAGLDAATGVHCRKRQIYVVVLCHTVMPTSLRDKYTAVYR